MQATAILVILAGRLVKILAAYLSPSRPVIGLDLTACFGGGPDGRQLQRQTRGF